MNSHRRRKPGLFQSNRELLIAAVQGLALGLAGWAVIVLIAVLLS